MALTPTTAASGFGCPCHGGQYDTEGNRVAGPPVRALDRYRFEIRDGRLVLMKPYSVAEVEGTGADAVIVAYDLVNPELSTSTALKRSSIPCRRRRWRPRLPTAAASLV